MNSLNGCCLFCEVVCDPNNPLDKKIEIKKYNESFECTLGEFKSPL